MPRSKPPINCIIRNSNSDSTDKDKKIDILFQLSEACWREFDTRRSYEWKVSFGLWTAIGIVAGFALRTDIYLQIPYFVIFVFLMLVFIAYLWWHNGLRNSNRKDQEKRFAYYRLIHNEIECKKLISNVQGNKINEEETFFTTPETSKGDFWEVWSHGSQILITIAFLLLLGMLLISKDFKLSDRPLHNHERIEYIR